MKLRFSFRMLPIVAVAAFVLGLLVALVLVMVEPEVYVRHPAFFSLAAAIAGALTLYAAIMFLFPTLIVQEDGLARRGRYGFVLAKTLEEGDQWVIGGDRLCIMRPDHTVTRLWVGKWVVNGRDWKQLEERYPKIVLR
ncbi:hypothetical protein [Glycomyces buryatensis]|uniref:Uncharacterized protein n=1 Tax=Glycomyces buryatensis TaxID=2570927 RepID=A0A4S8QHP2_9ACTN|nr:hypothetical protein [Glycomyces buryatensis]THV40204.1 hypothetical protein FAB82_16045 [Glycomyces buryatensis]